MAASDLEQLRASLDAAALKYLERFDASAKKLRTVLMKKARTLAAEPLTRDDCAQCIDELVARFVRSGIVDDARYAGAQVRNLRERGVAERAIVYRLSLKGVDEAVVREALSNIDSDAEQPELQAALRFLKRRRLGVHRSGEQTAASRRKDLQALARAGFSYDTAQRALGVDLDDDAF